MGGYLTVFRGGLQLRHLISIITVMFVYFLLTGFTETNENKKKVSIIPQDELYDIYFIKKAPKSTGKHDLSEAIKVVFTYSDSSVGDTIAIDIQEGIIHIEPWVSTLGVTSL